MKHIALLVISLSLVPTPAMAQSVTLPSGTHILLKLISPLNTTSATAGSGVYLETQVPVVMDNQMVIPVHTHVQGAVEQERRSGRVKGRAQLRMSFTSFILPDNRVLSIAGKLQDLPGSSRNRTVDAQGTLEPVDQIDRDVKGVVVGTLPGAFLGLVGAGRGPALRFGLAGGGLGVVKALSTRGDEIVLPVGTRVEMVLQRPLQLDRAEEKPKRSDIAHIGPDTVVRDVNFSSHE
jgi:hypothetical protein